MEKRNEQALNLLGTSVVIIAPDLEGSVEEVIFVRGNQILFKISVWLEGHRYFWVVSADEIEVKLGSIKNKRHGVFTDGP